jgi:hypothetical protein
MSVIGGISIWMVQAYVNTKVDLMILRVPPACVDDLVRVCRGINGTVGNSIIDAIMTIIGNPVSETVGPVHPLARVADACLWRRYSGRCRRRTKFECLIAGKCKHALIVCVVWCGMIEDRLLGGCARVRRVKKRRDRLCHRRLGRGAAHTEEKPAKDDGFENVLE